MRSPGEPPRPHPHRGARRRARRERRLPAQRDPPAPADVTTTRPAPAPLRTGHGLFLDDGTQIWVTYGEPSPGWESYVDKDVTVEAVIWTGPPPGSKQAVGGPHVSDWSEPATR